MVVNSNFIRTSFCSRFIDKICFLYGIVLFKRVESFYIISHKNFQLNKNSFKLSCFTKRVCRCLHILTRSKKKLTLRPGRVDDVSSVLASFQNSLMYPLKLNLTGTAKVKKMLTEILFIVYSCIARDLKSNKLIAFVPLQYVHFPLDTVGIVLKPRVSTVSSSVIDWFVKQPIFSDWVAIVETLICAPWFPHSCTRRDLSMSWNEKVRA